jgi:hypothetical protein
MAAVIPQKRERPGAPPPVGNTLQAQEAKQALCAACRLLPENTDTYIFTISVILIFNTVL